MSEKTGRGPRLVFVLKDGIRGHENQSEGIAWWLQELGGSEIVEIDVPVLSGFERFLRLKILARRLKSGDGGVCSKWLDASGGDGIREFVLERISTAGVKVKDVLFLSAGSSAAPWCLALARVIGGRCCTIMTPSILGTSPFDHAIVPEHDFPEPASNMLATLGAPNMIRPELLESEAVLLASRFPSNAELKWGILIGGDDANYTIPPAWVDEILKPLLEDASTKGNDIYITTSRRTLLETEERVESIVAEFPNVRMLVSGIKDSWNPVPGMLSFCDRIFGTEDSVSMISEAVTAGHVVIILDSERRKGIKGMLQVLTEKMVKAGSIPRRFMWGPPRFDLMVESFCQRGLAVRFGTPSETVRVSRQSSGKTSFNEARRASEWIIGRWVV